MDKSHMGQHIFRQYNAELEEVHSRVLEMGGVVEQQLSDAIDALLQGDTTRGEKVVAGDGRVNALELAIDEQCTHILALRQPAARDLRLVIAVIRTITDLERIGDEAKRIGQMALDLASRATDERVDVDVVALANGVQDTLHRALDAFARMDPAVAVAVAQSELDNDRYYKEILQRLVAAMEQGGQIVPWALDVLWSARSLERIGDRARNLCEYVIYLVHGKDVRHASLETMESLTREAPKQRP